MLRSDATSKRRSRGGDRCIAEAETKPKEQSSEKSSTEREEQREKSGGAKCAEQRRGAKAQSSRGAEAKTGRVLCGDKERETLAGRLPASAPI